MTEEQRQQLLTETDNFIGLIFDHTREVQQVHLIEHLYDFKHAVQNVKVNLTARECASSELYKAYGIVHNDAHAELNANLSASTKTEGK